MRKISKKYVIKMYELLQTTKMPFIYENNFHSEGDPFGALFVITEHSFTIVGTDWTDTGSETFYFRSIDEFYNIFKKERIYRIPLLQMIKKIEKNKE